MQLLEHDGNWTVLMDSYNGKKLNGPNDDFRRPNGLCFSPDEKKLYVVDTGATDGPNYPAHIRVFGGHKRNRLFMAGGSSMYSMYVNAVGAKTV